ncbi:MAG: hypothetical protein ACI8XB_001655 [Patiriisocius sp.]|jgi:hypothetical protein
MLDLIKKYKKAKKTAITLMQEGKLGEYVNKLSEVETLKMQLIKARV